MVRFHAQVSTHASVNGFMFSLDEVGVVRDLVLPMFTRDDVILDGKQVSMKQLEALARRPGEVATKAQAALGDTSVRIATIAGAFIGAATFGWMSTQQ